ncbi:MAG: RNA polymerase sigma factor [Betaproteobacteria bacterium]|nr:RNA polymerase sigma factor [Betaproteobacteria bacterium]MDE2047404.1 RNA polymerase sigma factor [Betaproteobacteria bacterium]
MTAPATDQELAQRIGAGDRDALGEAYARESDRVYRYVLAMTNNPALAADVLQDTFLLFAARPAGYRPERGPLQAYLVGIARHKVLAHWSSDAKHTSLDADGAPVLEADLDDDPGALLVARQDSEALMSAIARLPAPFREALVLVELQERSYAEAAAIAGIELNTLRTRLHRAKLKLAQMLAPAQHAVHEASNVRA